MLYNTSYKRQVTYIMPSLPRRLKHIAFDINKVLIDEQTQQEIKKTLFEPTYTPRIPKSYWNFVEQLSHSKYSAGIISNTTMTKQMIKALKLKDYFNPVMFGYTLGYPKPHPKIFDDYIALTGLQPNEIVYIDNNKNSLIYMHTLGEFTVWISEYTHKAGYISKQFVNLILHSVFDLQI